MGAHPAKNAVLKAKIGASYTPFEARSFEIGTALGTIDASTLSTQWKKYLVGQTNWTVSFELFYDPSDTAQATIVDNTMTGTLCKIVVKPIGEGATDTMLYGDCYVTNMRITGATEDAVGLSISAQGTDELHLAVNASVDPS